MKVYRSTFNIMNLRSIIKKIGKKNKELNIQLIKSVKDNNYDLAKSSLENGADINYYDGNKRAIHYAIENKNLDTKLLNLLLSKSGSITLKDLNRALYRNNHTFLTHWIELSNLKTLNSTKDTYGNNILHVVTQIFSKSESERELQSKLIRSLIEKGMDITHKNSYGRSPLQFLMISKKTNIVDLLNTLEYITKNNVVNQLPEKFPYETNNSHSIINQKSYTTKEEVKNEKNSSSIKNEIKDTEEKPQINYGISSTIATDNHSKKVHFEDTISDHKSGEYFITENEDTSFSNSQKENNYKHEFQPTLNSTFSSPESFPKKVSIPKDGITEFPKSNFKKKAIHSTKNLRLLNSIKENNEKPQISEIAIDNRSKKVHSSNRTNHIRDIINAHKNEEYFMPQNEYTSFSHSQKESNYKHEFQPTLNSTFSSPESLPKKVSIPKNGITEFPNSRFTKQSIQYAKNFRLLNSIKKNKDFNTIKEIIDEGANADYYDQDKKSCLYYAIENNNFEVIELLLKQEIDVNFQDNLGYSCLHWAIKHRNYKVVKELIRSKALVNLMGGDKIMPIHVAAYYGNVAIFQYLMLQKNIFIDAQDDYGNTALIISILQKNLNIVNSLLNNNASLRITDKNKSNVFHIAADVNDLRILETLLKKYNEEKTMSIKREDMINAQDFQGNTPLHIACHRGDTKIIKELIENGADISISNNKKQTPIRILKLFYKLNSSNLRLSEKKDVKNLLLSLGKKVPSSNIVAKIIMNVATKITSKI